MLKKTEVPVPPSRKEEVVPVPELGGDVLVRGMTLGGRLDINTTQGTTRMAHMLSICVFVEGETKDEMVPLYTSEGWETWGGSNDTNFAACLTLWDKARSLSDLGGEIAAKNSNAQNSESPAV